MYVCMYVCMHVCMHAVFQWTYTIPFLLAMGGDWLQGAYVYALYQSYGYSQQQIASLFVVGFGSAMIFGTDVMNDEIGKN